MTLPVRATACPVVFEITAAMRAWAAEKVPTVDIDYETEQFLDYHRARGNRFVDWVAAWRTWMRNAAKWARERVNRNRGTVVRDRIAAVDAQLRREGVVAQRLELGP